jgi:hypothetical protein
MTWLGELGVELERAGIRGSTRRRIETELADHLACDPASEIRLGSPHEVAGQFAVLLRTSRSARAARRSFLGLALTALLLIVHARAISPAGGWPAVSGRNATFVSLGGLLMVLGAQIAFVAGVLALTRRPVGAAEAALVQRRAAIALLAGVAVVAGEVVQATALAPYLAGWWYALALVIAAASLVALGACWLWVRSARAVTREGGPVPGLAADLPGSLRLHPAAFAVATGVVAVLLVGVGSTFAERSTAEGVTRGVLEAVAFAGCYLILRRPLAITPGRSSAHSV